MITIIVDEYCENCGAHLLACLGIARGRVESAQAWERAEKHLPGVWDHDFYGRCVVLSCTGCGAVHLWAVGSLEHHCIVSEEEEIRERRMQLGEEHSIDLLGLSPRVRNLLRRENYWTIGNVLKSLREEGNQKFLSIRGFGQGALFELREKLSARGFTVPLTKSGRIELLGLSANTFYALREAGLHRISDVLFVLAAKGDEGLLAIPGVGTKSVAGLKEKLALQGFRLPIRPGTTIPPP